MKLVKKVNHRIMALLCLVVALQTLLWIGAIITGALTINGGILLITLIFSFICTVGIYSKESEYNLHESVSGQYYIYRDQSNTLPEHCESR